jgi:hypothetical protein
VTDPKKSAGPDRKAIYDDEQVFEHESYGMLQFSRISGHSGRLFGSSLPDQGSFMRMRLVRGKRRHGLGRDWFYGESKVMVEVDLSANQFAELLTSMNHGSGVPCTIRFAEGRQMEKCPDEKLEAQQVRDDFKDKLKQVAKNMEESKKRIDAILAKKTTSKADREEVEKLLGLIIQDVESNIPFWLKSFHEATGKIIVNAKAEIDAFMTTAVLNAGYKALAAQNAPITVPPLLTEGSTEEEGK